MAVFSVFAFGTNEKMSMTHNIISQFLNACATDKLYIDGPRTLGFEVKENAEKASIELINWLELQENIENNINLAGFSRGSITCIYIANYLKLRQTQLEAGARTENEEKLLLKLKSLNLHIFAIDPVAGLRDKSVKYARVIPENVKSYVAVLQLDEMRYDFKPQDITRAIIEAPAKTKVSMLPMYGNHSDNTKIKSDDMASGPKLVWYALHQFFTQHGTQFIEGNKIPAIIYSNGQLMDLKERPEAKDLLRLFSSHHQEREAYRISGRVIKAFDGLPVPRVPRTLNNHLRFYVKDSEFFINQLERELCKIAYPRVFNYLFEKNAFDIRFPNASGPDLKLNEIFNELTNLKNDNAFLFERLKIRGVSCAEDGSITIDGPKGSSSLDPCNHIQQIFPTLVSCEEVKKHTARLNKLATLEREICLFTFRYQREKSELNFWSTRKQNHRVIEIRRAVHEIVDGCEDNDTKYILILDKLELEYKRMIQLNTGSQLTSMLQFVLKHHGREYQIKTHLANNVMLALVAIPFTLIKETISFVGHLGYIGGPALYGIGIAIESIGHRMRDIGELVGGPLQLVGTAVGQILIWFGIAIKNSLGLKPMTIGISNGIRNLKEALVISLSSAEIIRMGLDVNKGGGEEVSSDLNEDSVACSPVCP